MRSEPYLAFLASWWRGLGHTHFLSDGTSDTVELGGGGGRVQGACT